jgi:hypothetical protein
MGENKQRRQKEHVNSYQRCGAEKDPAPYSHPALAPPQTFPEGKHAAPYKQLGENFSQRGSGAEKIWHGKPNKDSRPKSKGFASQLDGNAI